MKIVVLAGGFSPERNVSLSSGCKVCAALRERGHEVAFVDMYLGTQEAPDSLFCAPIPEELTKINRQAPDLGQVKTARRGGGETLDEGFTWDRTSLWGTYETLRTYERPPVAEEPMPEDAYLQFTAENLAIMETWFQVHPETKFEIFLSPYSILAWDRAIRRGDLDARLAALELACETLTGLENVRLHAPLFAKDMVTELNNYCDYVHHSGEAGEWVLGNVCAEKFLLRPETFRETLAEWREFVLGYDYDALWDEEFWEQWYQEHDEPPAWYGGKED